MSIVQSVGYVPLSNALKGAWRTTGSLTIPLKLKPAAFAHSMEETAKRNQCFPCQKKWSQLKTIFSP